MWIISRCSSSTCSSWQQSVVGGGVTLYKQRVAKDIRSTTDHHHHHWIWGTVQLTQDHLHKGFSDCVEGGLLSLSVAIKYCFHHWIHLNSDMSVLLLVPGPQCTSKFREGGQTPLKSAWKCADLQPVFHRTESIFGGLNMHYNFLSELGCLSANQIRGRAGWRPRAEIQPKTELAYFFLLTWVVWSTHWQLMPHHQGKVSPQAIAQLQQNSLNLIFRKMIWLFLFGSRQ